MASWLYAEVYLICVVIVALCQYWTVQRTSNSASERWLHIGLRGFLISFSANLLFTVINSIMPVFFFTRHASWLLKTVYHCALCFGVFAWCGYADTECRGKLFVNRRNTLIAAIPLMLMWVMILANLATKKLFSITDAGYERHEWFQLEMGALVAFTTIFSVRLLIQSINETDPIKRGHQHLVASFPLCLIVAWVLTFAGESLPVICVTITIELLCLFMGTSTQQISMDKLTQVNNRQNLMSFLDYKLVNHDEKLFLLMMDLDYFKTINDTYGHLEGDDALVRAAQALKIACGSIKRRPYIARYGGDEFIVVIESARNDAEALIVRIREVLNEINAEANRPYNLAFSIGMAEFHPGMNANALIEAADNALYEVKRNRPGELQKR